MGELRRRCRGLPRLCEVGGLPDPLTKQAAIDLVRTLLASGGGDERTVSWLLDGLARRTGCLHTTDMIYWPSDRSPTAEEIIDRDLAARSGDIRAIYVMRGRPRCLRP